MADNKNSADNTSDKDCSVFELAAGLLSDERILRNKSSDLVPVVTAIRQLLTGLGTGETNLIHESLIALGAPQEHDLLSRVGHMTRTLHDSLSEFKASLDRQNITMSTTNIPDASDKLEAVIAMTNEAANNTMTQMERQSEIVLSANSQLKQAQDSINNATSLAEAKEIMQKLFAVQDNAWKEIGGISNVVHIAQSFQDLSGQALRKVIKLVTEIEAGLVQLIQVFGVRHGPPSEQPAVAAEVPKKEEPTEGLMQNDVDSILNSFGF